MSKNLKIILSLSIIVASIICISLIGVLGVFTPETSAVACPIIPECKPWQVMMIIDCRDILCGRGDWGVCVLCVMRV